MKATYETESLKTERDIINKIKSLKISLQATLEEGKAKRRMMKSFDEIIESMESDLDS